MAGALKELSSVARLGGKAETNQREVYHCPKCDMWSVRKKG